MGKLRKKNKKYKIKKNVANIVVTECTNCDTMRNKYNRMLSHYSDIVHHIIDKYGKDDVLIDILDGIMSDFTKVTVNPDFKGDKKWKII